MKMFTDTDIADKLAALKQRDKTVWEKIKDFFVQLKEQLTAAKKDYARMNAQSEAMKYFDALTDNVDRLTQLFAEGLNEIGNRTETESIKNTAEDGGTKYLIRESVTDVNGKVYDYVIDIDDDFTQKNINGRRYERFIDRMAGQIIGVTDIDGEKEFIMFANKNDKVRKDKKVARLWAN